MNAVTTDLLRSPSSVGAARRLVRAHSTSLDPKQRDNATLMVSELVTNALQHGVGTIWLRIDIEPDGLPNRTGCGSRCPTKVRLH